MLINGKGYERWAKVFNVKQVSKALLFLQSHGIRDYSELSKRTEYTADRFHTLSDSIKEKEERLKEIAELKKQIINYVKTKDIYAAYRQSGYRKKSAGDHASSGGEGSIQQAGWQKAAEGEGTIRKIRADSFREEKAL